MTRSGRTAQGETQLIQDGLIAPFQAVRDLEQCVIQDVPWLYYTCSVYVSSRTFPLDFVVRLRIELEHGKAAIEGSSGVLFEDGQEGRQDRGRCTISQYDAGTAYRKRQKRRDGTMGQGYKAFRSIALQILYAWIKSLV